MATYHSQLTELAGLLAACAKNIRELEGVNAELRSDQSTAAATDDLIVAGTYLRRVAIQLALAKIALGIQADPSLH